VDFDVHVKKIRGYMENILKDMGSGKLEFELVEEFLIKLKKESLVEKTISWQK